MSYIDTRTLLYTYSHKKQKTLILSIQKKHMKDKTKIALAAIAGIVILDAIALLKNIDGYLLATVFAILAGAAGFEAKDLYKKFKR